MAQYVFDINSFRALVKEKKFGEAVLFSWVFIEYVMNTILLGEFKLLPYKEGDPRASFLIEKIEFEEKYKLLKELGAFQEGEKKSITAFQNERNKFFHASLKDDFFRNFSSNEERDKLMALAESAFNAALSACIRYVNSSNAKK